MPLDSSMLFRDGTTADLEPPGETAPTSLSVDAYGAYVLDIRKTGSKGMVAVMVCSTAPTAHADTLTVNLQVSDHLTTDWKTIASWPVLYALNRRLHVKTTTAYVAASIGQTVTGGDTTDAGVIRWFDPALLVIGGEGDLVVSQVAADSYFDDVDENLTGGTGVSDMLKASELTRFLSYGVFPLRFVTTKRYARCYPVVTTGGSWGATLIGLVDDWNFPASGM